MKSVIFKQFSVVLFAACSLQGAALSVGVLGGAPFNDVTKNTVIGGLSSIPKSSNFTVGPVLQVSLPAGFRVEVDALFRPYRFDFESFPFRPVTTQVRARQWRFPVLVQYRFGGAIVKPYVGAGLSFGHLGGISDAAKNVAASGPGALLHQNDASPVIGVGLDLGVPLVRISAEIRYTRQTVSYFSNFSNLNQAEILVGIHF